MNRENKQKQHILRDIGSSKSLFPISWDFFSFFFLRDFEIQKKTDLSLLFLWAQPGLLLIVTVWTVFLFETGNTDQNSIWKWGMNSWVRFIQSSAFKSRMLQKQTNKQTKPTSIKKQAKLITGCFYHTVLI